LVEQCGAHSGILPKVACKSKYVVHLHVHMHALQAAWLAADLDDDLDLDETRDLLAHQTSLAGFFAQR